MAERHFLTNFLDKNGYEAITGKEILRSIHVSGARHCLKQDRDAFVMNGLITFAGAIHAIHTCNYSWAFIQCYYAVFYLAEALLATQDVGIYYIGKKPYSIKTSAGEHFTKKSGNSHQVIFALYKDRFDGDDFLCGEIDGKNVIDWFNNKREEINYRKNPMDDPFPSHPIYKYSDNLRTWFSAYRDEYLYSFDPAHAYVAFPLQLIGRIELVYEREHSKNLFITKERVEHLAMNISDKRGPIHWIIEGIKGISNTEKLF